MRDTTGLVCTQEAGHTEVIGHDRVAENHACMIAKDSMDVYLGLFCITVANTDKADLNVRKHQEISDVASAQQEIVHISDERFSYTPGCEASKRDSPVNAIHYKPALNRLEEMADHEAIKKNDESILKKNWREAVQLPPRSRIT